MSLSVTAPVVTAGVKPRVAVGTRLALSGATSTLYFRRTDGTRGSTTDEASLPAGAVVERVVTG